MIRALLRSRPNRVAALLLLTVSLAAGTPALATTAHHLNGRIHIDGFTDDFAPDEIVFGTNTALNLPEESTSDSKWSPDQDFHQIRVTWDAESLYVAGEGVINSNNMIILLDVVAGRGLTDMTQLNSWRRNFSFSSDFAPDLFCATWDTNNAPRLLIHRGGSQVDDQQAGVQGVFNTAASFSGTLRGRAMEFAIPWNVVFLGTQGLGTTPRYVPSLGETLQTFLPGAQLKIAGVITGGGDGTSGPDVAPDNTSGAASDAGQIVVVDNYAIIDLDRNDDTGTGGGGPDGIADWNVSPKSRVSFKYEPPISGVRFSLGSVHVDRPAFAPERGAGETVHFTPVLEPALDPNEPINQKRTISLTAGVFDLRGGMVRQLYGGVTRPALSPTDPAMDVWDGRDAHGVVVTPGVYVIRMVLEPNASRATRAVVVVR